MTFLNPAFLIGLLAAGIPVIIHLLNLKKLKKIEFSTLIFLKELQKQKIRRIKMKQWLLLVLRVLIILFVVFAFSRPTVDNLSLSGFAPAAKASGVIIIDNSYSMNLKNENGTLFNQAKEIAAGIVNGFKEGDEGALILTAASPGAGLKMTKDRTELLKHIKESGISSYPGNTANAVLEGIRLLEGTANLNKYIYLFTDFQKSGGFDAAEVMSFNGFNTSRITLITVNLPSVKSKNLYLSEPGFVNRIFEKKARITVNVRTNNPGDEDISGRILSLFVNGERIAQKTVRVEAGASVLTEFTFANRSTGFSLVELKLDDDEIPEDNSAYLSFYTPERIRTLIYADKQENLRFVDLALTLDQENPLFRITKSSFSGITADIEKTDAVILNAGNNQTDFSSFREYLNNGGGILIFPDREVTPENLRKAFASLGLPQPEGFVGNKESKPFTGFGETDFSHPVFEGLFEKGNKKEIESPGVSGYFKISRFTGGRRIISLRDNSVFMGEKNQGKGKVLFFTSTPDPQFSDLVFKPIFVPLLYKSLFYIVRWQNSDTVLKTGDYAENLDRLTGTGALRILKPDGNDEYREIKRQSPDNRFGPFTQSGFHRFFEDKNLRAVYPVNINEKESMPGSITSDEFRKFMTDAGFTGEIRETGAAGGLAGIFDKLRMGTELWKFFLILALILTGIEMILARNSKKDLASDK